MIVIAVLFTSLLYFFIYCSKIVTILILNKQPKYIYNDD